ncbi:MAG: hypothetical protein ACKOFJ_08135 [Actinomycetota bacterium]
MVGAEGFGLSFSPRWHSGFTALTFGNHPFGVDFGEIKAIKAGGVEGEPKKTWLKSLYLSPIGVLWVYPLTMCVGCLAVAMASMTGPAPTVEVPTFIAAPTQIIENEVVVAVPTLATAEIVRGSANWFDLYAV